MGWSRTTRERFLSSLADVLSDVEVVEESCATLESWLVTTLVEGGEVVRRSSARAMGRYLADPAVDPYTGEVIAAEDEEVVAAIAHRLHADGVERVAVRSPLTCGSEDGICSACFGRDPTNGEVLRPGASVGSRIFRAWEEQLAAAEPRLPLASPGLPIGHVPSGLPRSVVYAACAGTVSVIEQASHEGQLVPRLDTAVRSNGETVAMGYGRVLVIVDEEVLQQLFVGPGTTLEKTHGDPVERGEVIARGDPDVTVVQAQTDGFVRFGNLFRGHSLVDTADGCGGARERVADVGFLERQPFIAIVSVASEPTPDTLPRPPRGVMLHTDAAILVEEGQHVVRGDALTVVPRRCRAIDVGLARIIELLEATTPERPALLSEIDGRVQLRRAGQGRQIVVEPDVGERVVYGLPANHRLTGLASGDRVRAGDVMTRVVGCRSDGTWFDSDAVDPVALMRVLGPTEYCRRVLDELIVSCREAGIELPDAYLEMTVRELVSRQERRRGHGT